jgi:Domain of unknown function (DUF1772)
LTLDILQAAATLIVAIAMSLALAHALELPGKLRLPKEQYLAVQPIYYPGFTFGGASEPLGLIALLLLLFFTPVGTLAFWLTVGAFIAFAAMHAVYWFVTHPVNNFWLQDVRLEGFGASFFRIGSGDGSKGPAPDWTVFRDQWEYSHVARAALSMLSLVLLVWAMAASEV